MKWEHFGLNTQRALYKKVKSPYNPETKLYFVYRERIDQGWKYGFNDDACFFSKKKVLRVIRDHLMFLKIGRVEYEND